MNARENILARIRKAQARHAAPTADLQQHLAQHPRGPMPPPPDDLIATFKSRALKLSSDVVQTEHRRDIPALLANYLREKSLPLQAVCWSSLENLPWQDAGIAMQARPARADDLVGVTGAFCAIAETGTLMMLSGAATPATTSLLPETHVAIVETRRIVASMEEAWDSMRKEVAQVPRTVNFISGPSRTADIEQTLTLGAHGPYRVLLILVSD